MVCNVHCESVPPKPSYSKFRVRSLSEKAVMWRPLSSGGSVVYLGEIVSSSGQVVAPYDKQLFVLADDQAPRWTPHPLDMSELKQMHRMRSSDRRSAE